MSLHRARSEFIKSRIAQSNQIRGLLGEFGIVLPQGISHVARRIPDIIEDADNELPPMIKELLLRLLSYLIELNHQIEALDNQITAWHKSNEDSKRLEKIPGFGVLTASALVASIGNANCFKKGFEIQTLENVR